ncbi:MAG: entericidin EcnAB [Alphaproteobacteria bacterium]|jgi:predicted small secreted protein|nr:entericidin EcnAB [Thalassospira sp.]MCE2964433.1 entericidin EcnAB [Alphaproteobacteria bacterium]
MRILTLLVLFALTACNTVQGLGTDIRKTGETLERTAK